MTQLEPASQKTDNYVRVHLAAGEDKFSIAALDISSFGVNVGDSVELSWVYSAQLHPPLYTRLSMLRAGRQAFWYTVRNEDPLPEGFSYAWGEVQCRGSRLCATWDSKKLRVTGPCDDTVELGTDERGAVCGYDVVPGFLQYRSPDYADDACDIHARVGIEITVAHPQTDDESDAGAP